MVRDWERERTGEYTEVIGYMLISYGIQACGKSSKYFGICLVMFKICEGQPKRRELTFINHLLCTGHYAEKFTHTYFLILSSQ